MKIAVVFDTLHPDWEDADYKKEVDAKVEEAEYDVARALMAQGHDVLMVGVAEPLHGMLERLAAFQPKLVFNGCESFRGQARHEYALAAVLEMHGYRYTGSPPTALVELTFGESNGDHRIATYKAKWDEDYRKRKKIRNVFAKGLADDVTTKIADICTTAFHALWLQDYGRVDLRLTHDNEVYVLEVNPNPFLAYENEMADAAEKAGMSYADFIERIVTEALARGAA